MNGATDHDLLVRIDERMKNMEQKLDIRINNSDALHEHLQTQIEALKSLAWKVTGAITLVTFLLTVVLRVVVR